MEIKEYSKKLEQSIGKKNSILSQLENRKKEKQSLEKLRSSLEIAQVFIQKVAKDTQQNLKFHIEDIVQLAIDSCFPGEYNFQVNFEIKRGQTEASLVFMKNGIPVDPVDASGGGVVDLAAFALRIAVWSLGKTERIIILDEPVRFLSRNLHHSAGEILKKLSEKLELQIIMVTHNQEMEDVSDKVFIVKKEGLVSMVKEMENK